ncbi:hypothetical protein [Rhodobacter lacus]|uniref:Uncharacterized protein n=1 Tax=Rhodobacter lacus TaxID=1641972 RepID=A0ABW5A6G2_9RHOB
MRRRIDTMQKEGMTNPRQTIWDAIRELAGEDLAKHFTVTDVVDRTGAHRKTTADYFACLVAAEYLAHGRGGGAECNGHRRAAECREWHHSKHRRPGE